MIPRSVCMVCRSDNSTVFGLFNSKSVFVTQIDNIALKSVVLPTSLVAISDSAFKGCRALRTAIIPT